MLKVVAQYRLEKHIRSLTNFEKPRIDKAIL